MIAGAGIGTALASAFSGAMDLGNAQGRLKAQLGLTTEEAARAGSLAGDLYSNNFGADMNEVTDAIANVAQQMGGFGNVSNEELTRISEGALGLSSIFGTDVNGSIAAASKLVKSGMAPDMTTAFDQITRGMQTTGIASDDLLDTIGEYTPYLSSLGVDGAMAFGMMGKAQELGIQNTDKWADAMKEFGIRAIDGSATSIDAYQSLGLSAEDTAAKIAAGGPGAAQAMSQVVQALQGIEDPIEQNRIGVQLFGTQWEDSARTALGAFDPLANAMDDVAGATDRANAAFAETPEQKIAGMQRSMQGFLMDLTQAPGVLGTVGTALNSFGPEAISMAGSLGMAGMAFGPLVARAAGAVGPIIGSFAATSGAAIRAGAVMAGQAALQVGRWVLMAGAAVINAAIIAAAWLAANPIALIAIAIAAIVALIVANWDHIVNFLTGVWNAIKTGVSTAWNSVLAFLTGIINGIVNFFVSGWNNLKNLINQTNANIASMISGAWNGIVGFFSGAWDRIKSAVQNGISGVLGFVRGLPGQILSAIGNLGNLLYNAGTNIIQGLWNGIRSMGNWLKNQVLGFVRSFVPGPVLRFLGIASPSKLFAEMGQWIPEGLAKGIDSNADVASIASAQMAADVARAASGMGGPTSSAIPRGQAASGMTVIVNVEGSVTAERDLLKKIEQGIIRTNRNNGRLAVA
jgi:phage-related minor tail protein